MAIEGEVSSEHKVECVFKFFDRDLDGALNQVRYSSQRDTC